MRNQSECEYFSTGTQLELIAAGAGGEGDAEALKMKRNHTSAPSGGRIESVASPAAGVSGGGRPSKPRDVRSADLSL